MEEPKNAKLFLALKSRYALHNTDRLVEFILDDQKTSFDFITEIIPQIEEENKKAPKLFKVTVDTDIFWKGYVQNKHVRGNTPLMMRI